MSKIMFMDNEYTGLIGSDNIQYATRSSIATGGTIAYMQIGKLVLVQIYDFTCATNTNGSVLATGLPKRTSYIPLAVLNSTAASSVGWRVAVDANGNLINHWPGPTSISQACGSFWYIAA